jgi:hypothetical protein
MRSHGDGSSGNAERIIPQKIKRTQNAVINPLDNVLFHVNLRMVPFKNLPL